MKKAYKIIAVGIMGALTTVWAYLIGVSDKVSIEQTTQHDMNDTDENEEELSADTN